MEVLNEILMFFKDSHPVLYSIGSALAGAFGVVMMFKKQWQSAKVEQVKTSAETGLLERMQSNNIQLSESNAQLTNEKIKYSQMLDIATEEIRKLHTEKHEYMSEIAKLKRIILTNDDLIERLTEKINELKSINNNNEVGTSPITPPTRIYKP